jgi:hypothetical protein
MARQKSWKRKASLLRSSGKRINANARLECLRPAYPASRSGSDILLESGSLSMKEMMKDGKMRATAEECSSNKKIAASRI